MSSKNKIPAIRIKSFSDEWQEKYLGEISPLRGGFAFASENYCDFGIPIVRISNINSDGSIGGDFIYYKENVDDLNYSLTKGSVLLAMSGATTGKVAVLNCSNKHYQNQRVGYFSRLENIDYTFIAILVKSHLFIKQLQSVLVAGAQPNVSSKDIDNFIFYIPKEKDEQEKIGNYFKNIDHLITQSTKRLEKLKNLKKAYLEKMFPRGGATTPELRFKGFSEEWKENSLGQIGRRFDNLRIPVTAKDRLPGQTPYYGANGIQDYVQGYTHIGEYLLIAEDGANDVINYPIQYVSGKIWVNNHAHVYQAIDGVSDNLCIKYVLSHADIKSLLVGGGRAKLNAETMMGIKIILPKDIDEQKKIGNFFRNIDEQIAKQNEKLEKLKNIKKACLDKMFV